MPMKKRSVFGLSFLCGLLVVLGLIFYNRPRHTWAKAHAFTPEISITEQIKQSEISTVRRYGFRTIIDLRPDGEAADQVPSADVERAARALDMKFFYVPVQHGPIPDSSVQALEKALRNSPTPVLVYCRSGKRAARTLALVEASRPAGPDATTILAMVRSAGQSADDLTNEIQARIAHRAAQAGAVR
jgi:uncharacterized protein (TIGR01244 family)